MSSVFILADFLNGKATKVTFELATAASRIGDVVAIILAPIGEGAARAATLTSGPIASIIIVESSDFQEHGVSACADAITQLISQKSPAAFLVSSSAYGKEIAANVAVKTNSGVITDAVDIDSNLTATQVIFGGSATVHSKVINGTSIITLRPNCITPDLAACSATIENIALTISATAKKATVKSSQAPLQGGRPELTEANIVVSGGRGTNGDFAAVEAFADSLGAAVGASRAATDAGWYPHSHQVGQTGKTVSPQLYVACGISGAIQHRAGMQTSKAIIVINKDAEAPIFELADFGVIGDLFAVLPAATEGVKSHKS